MSDFPEHRLAAEERRVRTYYADLVRGDWVVRRRRDGIWESLGTVYRSAKPYANIEIEMYGGTMITAPAERVAWIVIPKVPTLPSA